MRGVDLNYMNEILVVCNYLHFIFLIRKQLILMILLRVSMIIETINFELQLSGGAL